MRVAKLSDGRIVRYLKDPQPVPFAAGQYVLVSDRLTTNPRRTDPHWVPATMVAWVLDFSEL